MVLQSSCSNSRSHQLSILSLNHWFSSGHGFAFSRYLAMSGDSFYCHSFWGWGALLASSRWQGRDAAKPLMVHRTAPRQRMTQCKGQQSCCWEALSSPLPMPDKTKLPFCWFSYGGHPLKRLLVIQVSSSINCLLTYFVHFLIVYSVFFLFW